MSELAGVRSGEIVRDLRAKLLEAGFGHANAVGELVSLDGTTWVSSGYSGGEYRIAMWRKPSGSGVEQGRIRMRIHDGSKPELVDVVAKELSRWAVKVPVRTRVDLVWLRIEKAAEEAGPIG